MSATVPNATRSRKSFRSGSGLSLKPPVSLKAARIAIARKKASPTPDKFLNGNNDSGRWGLITGQMGSKQHGGAIAYFSGGTITQQDLFEFVLTFSLLPFLSTDLYGIT